MSTKQKEALKLIKKFSPKPFGIKSAYYRTNDGKLELIFVVSEKGASSSISYLNSLTSLIEKEVKGIEIESNIYIYDKGKKVEDVAREEDLKKMDLVTDFKFAGVCA